MMSIDPQSIKVPDFGTTPEEHAEHDLMLGIKAIAENRPAYREAHAFFDGSIEEWFSDPRISAALASSAEAYKFKLAAVPVHTLAERVQLKGIKVDEEKESTRNDTTAPTAAPEPKKASPQQDAWDKISKANNLRVWGPEIHERTFEYGDGYVFVWEAPEGFGEGTSDNATVDDDEESSGVVIVWNSPFNARKIYDTENNVTALFDIKYYKIGDFHYADLYYRDVIRHYRTKNKNALGVSIKDWEPFEVFDKDDPTVLLAPAVEENPFGELPLKHARTGLPYGEPEHKAAYGPQRAIAKMLVTQIATVDAHGWPTRYALTDPEAAINEGSDTPPWDDDETAGLIDANEIRRRQPQQNKPGVLQYLNGVKAAGEWKAADPAVFTDPVQLYMQLMSTLTRTPFYSFNPGGEQPSGKARQIADAPFDAKKRNRQDHLTDFWTEVVTFALRIVGKEPKNVEIVWAGNDLASDLEDWQMIREMMAAGVPFKLAMLRAGFDEETIDAWIPEDEGLREAAETLGAIGDAIGKIGAGVGLGVISSKQVNAIIAKLLEPYGVDLSFEEVEAETEQRKAEQADQLAMQMDHDKAMAKEKGAATAKPAFGAPK